MPPKKLISVYVTGPNLSVCKNIALTLVKERLVACANILPEIESVYEWKAVINEEREHVMLLKTRLENFKRVEKRIRELHPYETPCIVSLEISKSSKPYLDWVWAQTAPLMNGGDHQKKRHRRQSK